MEVLVAGRQGESCSACWPSSYTTTTTITTTTSVRDNFLYELQISNTNTVANTKTKSADFLPHQQQNLRPHELQIVVMSYWILASNSNDREK